jgi:creatinine amidohydrolase
LTTKKYLYENLTWPEIREAIRNEKVAIVPIGTIEDHGYHLPVNTDNMICWEICVEAVKRVPDKTVLLPLVPYGINEHHFDFPGAIDIPGDVFIGFLLGITRSLAHHGFKRIILINAHGSNKHYVGIAARRTVIESNVLCVATTPMLLMGKENINKIRKSEPGGICHAGELETAIYLYRHPELVQMDKAVKEYGLQESDFFGWDKGKDNIEFMDWWSNISESGVVGNPTVATAESGKKFFDLAVNQLIKFIEEYKTWEIRKRKNHK